MRAVQRHSTVLFLAACSLVMTGFGSCSSGGGGGKSSSGSGDGNNSHGQPVAKAEPTQIPDPCENAGNIQVRSDNPGYVVGTGLALFGLNMNEFFTPPASTESSPPPGQTKPQVVYSVNKRTNPNEIDLEAKLVARGLDGKTKVCDKQQVVAKVAQQVDGPLGKALVIRNDKPVELDTNPLDPNSVQAQAQKKAEERAEQLAKEQEAERERLERERDRQVASGMDPFEGHPQPRL